MNYDKKIIQDFISKQPYAAAQLLEKENPAEIASFFEHYSTKDVAKIFRNISAKKSAEILTLLPENVARELIEQEEVSQVSRMLIQIEVNVRQRLLVNISTNRLHNIEMRLRQLPNTIGTLMMPSYSINKSATIGEAEELLRKNAEENQTLIYVTDDDGVLVGAINSFNIFYNADPIAIEKIMTTNLPTFVNDSSLTNILDHEIWTENDQVAVVDKFGKFLGYLTHKMLRENTIIPKGLDKVEINKTGTAIGEIYKIGLSGLVQTVGQTRESN